MNTSMNYELTDIELEGTVMTAINAKSDVLGERELDAVSGGTILEMFDQIFRGMAGATGGGDPPVDGPTRLFQETLQQVAKGAA